MRAPMRRKLLTGLGVVLGSGLCTGLCAGSANAATEAGFTLGHEQLIGSRGAWQQESLFLEQKAASGNAAGLRANSTRRFGLNDLQLEGFYNWSLDPKNRVQLDAAASPSHRVLPSVAVGTSLQHELSRGWLLQGGARQSRYDVTTVNQLSLGSELYVGDWALALTWYDSHALGERTQTVVGRLSRYTGERNRINLLLSAGCEPVSLGGTVLLSDVRSFTLTGRYWLRPTLGIDYAVGVTRQGDLYTRTGASFGLVAAF